MRFPLSGELGTANRNRPAAGARACVSYSRAVSMNALLLLLLFGSVQLHGFVVSPPHYAASARWLGGSSSARRRPHGCMMSGGGGAITTAGRRETTWSNPTGDDMVQVLGDVWCAERPFVWNGIDVGGRMAVVKLSDGSLWVHSPVDLDEPLKEALASLGPVGHIVSPNYEHVKYAKQWVEAYPSAISYACPGLAERQPEVGFTREVGASIEDESLPEWGDEIRACFMDCENNPFTGKPFFNEVVFFHRPTKTLITSDLYWNYPRKEVPFGTRVWKWGMDKVYLPFYKKFVVTDGEAFASKVNQILDWGVETIVPCHGGIVRSGAPQQALRQQLL
ncbi:unnamed protein product [Ectocarpus sp. 4 AP-2014]